MKLILALFPLAVVLAAPAQAYTPAPNWPGVVQTHRYRQVCGRVVGVCNRVANSTSFDLSGYEHRIRGAAADCDTADALWNRCACVDVAETTTSGPAPDAGWR